MNTQELKGNWNQVKGKIKQQYGIATDDDAAFTEGKFDEIVGRIQEKTGKTRQRIKEEISKW
jgi:uncharacterized protein YjbJ (UPF0337 family)